MKLWKRRLLLIMSFGLFFVVSPMLVLYAMGYRYDFENKTFRKIGMIILESKPDNAGIFVNNNYSSETPFRIKNLLPKEYSIRVEKDGYNSWEKKLNVESKKVTWASNIILFYNNPLTNTLSDIEFINFDISSDYKKIIASSIEEKNYGLWFVDLGSREFSKIFPLEEKSYLNSPLSENDFEHVQYNEFIWSPNKKKVISAIEYNNQKNYLILDIDKEIDPIFLNNSFDLEVENVQWKSNNEIYLLDTNKNLHQINLDFNYPPKILLDNVAKFKFDRKNNIIAFINFKEDNISLNFLMSGEKKSSINLPHDEDFEIAFGQNNDLALLMKNKKELLLLDINTNKPKSISNNVNSFQWSRSGDKLLFFNNNELWFYALKKNNDEIIENAYSYNETNLLTRYSTKINNASWYPNEEYVAISLDKDIKIIELDGRGIRNCQEYKNVYTDNKNNLIEFDKKGENIYFISNDILKEMEITGF